MLNTLNIRLDAEAIAFQLTHGEAKVLITDREFSHVVKPALSMLERPILVIDIDDPLHEGGTLLGDMDYEAFLREGDPDFDWSLPEDEFGPISLNYTSGTTGNPKGVVTHHRGAYLNAMSQIVPGVCRLTRSICGPCRCSTATAGAFRGRWRPMPVLTSVCGGWTRS